MTKLNQKIKKQSVRKPDPRPKRLEDDQAIGMWADREDMKDVHAWLEKIRTPRYLRAGEGLFPPPRPKS